MEPAFRILDAIARDSGSVDVSRDGHWIEALKTIRWVAESTSGLALTVEGRRAHGDLAVDLRMARRKAELA